MTAAKRQPVAQVQGAWRIEGIRKQAIALFLPVVEGTLVVYLNHTSTDQVLGFGGSAKRAIGERVMLGQLEDLFGKLRDSAAKSQ